VRNKRSPYLAKFRIPLYFTKFDVRDYLLHIYGLEAVRVNTGVQQGRPFRNTMKSQGMPGRWYMSSTEKYAFVEMKEPFVYPDPPSVDERGDYGRSDLQMDLLRYEADKAARKNPGLASASPAVVQLLRHEYMGKRWGPSKKTEETTEGS